MSNKKPTSNHPQKVQQIASTNMQTTSSLKTVVEPAIEIKEVAPVKVIEEYKPSVNAAKYPEPEKPKNQYKILASRNDYIKLQEEVVNHLNNGWELVGGVSNSTSVGQYESITIFVQAVRK